MVVLMCLSACGTPVTPKFAPPAASQPAASGLESSRVIAVPYDSVFPRILDVLLDRGFLIRSANAELGLVSFYQQWVDNGQLGATITTEGTILLHRTAAGTTQIKLAITGNWQMDSSSIGKYGMQSSTVGGATQTTGNDQYRQMLDLIEQGLSAR